MLEQQKMAGRGTSQRFARPPSPASSPSSTRFRQQQHQGRHHLQEENPNRADSAHPLAPSKPTTPFLRSRLARQEDFEAAEYGNDNDLWDQSQQYLNDSQGAGCKNGRNYSSYTTSAENKISRFPGPGAYNLTHLKPGGPSFSMGSRASLRKVRTERSYSPGPGSYDVCTKNSGPSFSIAPKVRPPVSQQDLNPGPGTYSDLSNAFGRGLSFSIRERFK